MGNNLVKSVVFLPMVLSLGCCSMGAILGLEYCWLCPLIANGIMLR